MSNYAIQISIWVISYFFVGENGYIEKYWLNKKEFILKIKTTQIFKISFYRAIVFLILSLIVNGTTNLFYLTLLPTLGIWVINYCGEPRIKGKPIYFILTVIAQVMLVVSSFLIADIFDFNYNDLLNSLRTKNSDILKITSIIICLTPANYVIRIVLDKFLPLNNWKTNSKSKEKKKKKDKENSESLEKAGRLIGNIERTLTLVLLYSGQYEAIGFIIAAKSIIRTREEKADSEYILIGSLLSFGLAILIGMVVERLIKI